MKGLLTIAAIVVLLAGHSQPATSFEAGNAAYANKDWATAITNYSAALDSGYNAAALHFNLANAYYQSKQLGPAILHYERAWRLDPTDPDIQFNKQLANLQVIDKVTPDEKTVIGAWWASFLLTASTNGWTYAALAFFLITGLLGILFLVTLHRFWRPFAFFGSITTLVLALLLSLIAHQRLRVTQPAVDMAIIMTPNVYVKSAPTDDATDLFILHEGLQVEVQDTGGDWVRITVSQDKQGWVPAASLAII